MPHKKPLAYWLESQYLDWQKKEGGRRTIIEFADYLKVNRSLLSYWMNSQRDPSEENLVRIAVKLGFEVYDIVGLPRPDPDLIYLQAHWLNLPAKAKKAIREEAEKYVTKKKD